MFSPPFLTSPAVIPSIVPVCFHRPSSQEEEESPHMPEWLQAKRPPSITWCWLTFGEVYRTHLRPPGCTPAGPPQTLSLLLYTVPIYLLKNKLFHSNVLRRLQLCRQWSLVIPNKLTHKTLTLGLYSTLSNWLSDFGTGRPRSLRIGDSLFSHHHHRHWHPTRVRPQPLRPVHPRLCCLPQRQQHH